jgi:outer membrane protein OmpA-like peptidoglycan-associated protein
MLSSRRAEAVAQFLLSMGLPKHRVTWQGFGRERPIASNSTDEGRKQNRRVEFVISEFSSKE